ncbi:MAG: TraR/DksA family transcriptional regulator [Bryobacteraceae bacterium]
MTHRADNETVRKRLLAERSRVMSRLMAEGRPFEALPLEAEDDQPPLLHEEFITASLNDLEFDLLYEIDTALDKLARGDYGWCDDCGSSISARRLEAMPWARRCIACEQMTAVPMHIEEGLVAV